MKKGFYASLAVGVIAITAVGIIASQNTGSQEQPEHLAQIEQRKPLETKQPEAEPPATKQPEPKQEEAKQEEAKPVETKQPEEAAPQKVSQEAAPEASLVMSGADSLKGLSFREEDGLTWPVVGDILLKYSMDNSIYFKTLAQYKCNPAVVIGAKEGTEVLSAGRSIVTEISENEETGVTLTATLGNGYEVVYGQLTEVGVKTGDVVERGSVIGKIAKPTKYYVEEGSNLYFKVLEDGEPIDPLLLLQ